MRDAFDETLRAGEAHRPGAPDRLPMCYFCSSTDTMEPFLRSDHIFFLTKAFPRLRARYCRTCTRHFLALAPRPR